MSTPPAPSSFQTLGYYMELCEFFGWHDVLDVLRLRVQKAAQGRNTRCQTPHGEMVAALFKAQVKAAASEVHADNLHPQSEEEEDHPGADEPEEADP